MKPVIGKAREENIPNKVKKVFESVLVSFRSYVILLGFTIYIFGSCLPGVSSGHSQITLEM